MKRWEVIYIRQSMYDGIDGAPQSGEISQRTRHRTYAGADWHRRFHRDRSVAWGVGFQSLATAVVRTEEHLRWDDEALYAAAERGPKYVWLLDFVVWPVVYFIRNRWNGLRYGLDRDAR